MDRLWWDGKPIMPQWCTPELNEKLRVIFAWMEEKPRVQEDYRWSHREEEEGVDEIEESHRKLVLTSTNERNYQTPFCQVLLSKGHRIIYVSPTSDGAGEGHHHSGQDGNAALTSWRQRTLTSRSGEKILGEVKGSDGTPIVHIAGLINQNPQVLLV